MTVGEVHWVDFPPRGGHEQAGRRPAIIAQGASASARLPTVLVIPLTTRQDALRFPGTLAIEADSDNGLRRASVAMSRERGLPGALRRREPVPRRRACCPLLGDVERFMLKPTLKALQNVEHLHDLVIDHSVGSHRLADLRRGTPKLRHVDEQ